MIERGFTMGFIKGFKDLVPGMIQTIIIVLLAGLTVGYALNNNGTIWQTLALVLPVLFVAIAVIGLELKGLHLAAYLVLLITSFLGAGREFVLTITSFDLSSFSFNRTFSLELIINLIVFVYLALMIISYGLSKSSVFKLEGSDVLLTALIAFLFFFFRDGFSTAVLKILPTIVALGFGSKLFAIVLLLAGVIDVPFNLLHIIFNGDLFAQPFYYFIFTAFAIYLIIGAVKGILAHK